MYKEVLQSINGIEIIALIALLIFIVFFVFILIRLIKMDKSMEEEIARLPLEPDNNSQNLSGE
jgi:hypothetical protein